MIQPIDTERQHKVVVRRIRALRGPNIHAYMPVLQITMEIGEYDELPSCDFPGFAERLVAWLPGLHQHKCSLNRPGGFIERLHRGTYLPHITEHIALELQGLMGFRVAFGRARGTGEPGVYTVVLEYKEEEPARAAFNTALRLTLAAMHDEPFDVQAEIARLRDLADDCRLGPTTEGIVAAARARKIPVMRLTPTGSLIQLGYGIHQRRLLASQTSYTGAIAVDVCQDKSMTNDLLRRVGVPVPDGRVVHSADDAWQAAQAIGLPVVVKPADANQGKGVSVNLVEEEQVRQAYQIATQFSDLVQVERFIHGQDYRLLVINGKLVAAARRDPPQVEGDGVQTIAALIARLNEDPRRQPGHGSVLSTVEINEAVELTLAQQGLTLESIPQPGQTVWLRANGNLSTGGTATDVTDEVHPDNVHLAQLAAQVVGLDIAGIDLLCHDIGLPLAEQGGAVVEVNAAPGLRMHLHPSAGTPRDVGAPIIDMLYPDGHSGRIPIIAVTGTNGKTTVTRLLGHMFETDRWVVGLTCTDGVYVNGKRVLAGDCSGPNSARTVLLHPQVEVAILETARGGILREGLAFDRCSVGVVTNISADHLGLEGVHTLDDLARVKQVVVEAVSPDGAAVLNAEDPLVAAMAAASDGRVIYFSRSPHHPVMAAHLAKGGRGVFVHRDAIVLASHTDWNELVPLERVPFTAGGKIGFQVMNALAATAAAWAAGINPALIGLALTTFRTTEQAVPGRFNRFELNGVEVILDYGHNTAALQALGEAVQALGHRRTVMVFTLPGDRRNQDIADSTRATRAYVDAYVVYDSKDLRGRAPLELPRLVCAELPDDVLCEVVSGQCNGILAGWRMARPGDRLIIIADEVEEALGMLHRVAGAGGDEEFCTNQVLSTGGIRRLHPANAVVKPSQPNRPAAPLLPAGGPNGGVR